ncbi:MAG TPA: autotransporter-associated beta strand repeat-containing protein, partial [Verrucomicrobiae bacterium]
MKRSKSRAISPTSSTLAWLCVLSSCLGALPAAAVNLTWDAGNTANGSTIDAASGTWDTTSLIWNNGTSDVAWTSANGAKFGGTDGAYTITLGSALTCTNLVFANSGYALAANSALALTINSTGSGTTPNLQVAGGKTATIGANVTAQVTGGTQNLLIGPAGGAGVAGGELDIASGGTVQITGTSTLGLVGNGAIIDVKAGGLFKRTTTGAFLLGSGANDNCTLNVEGAVVLGGSGAVRIGGNSTTASLAGTLNLNGGTFSMDAANTTVPMTLGVNSGNLGTNNLNGGTLSVNQIVKGNAGATAVMNFNGGTLQAVNGALAANFLNGLTAANIRNSGAVIDNNGFNLVIGQALLHSPVAGDLAVDGGLTCQGTGTVTLNGANTYTGPTIVKAGALTTTTLSAGAGAYAVSNNAVLGVQVVSTGGTLALASLALGTGTGDHVTNNFALSTNASTSTPAISISGQLSLNGAVTVNVNGSTLTGPNTYPLVSYGQLTGAGTLLAGTLPTVAGMVVSLTNDANAKQIALVLSVPPPAESWRIGDGVWDTSSLNWTPLGGGSPMAYAEGALVAFDDSASGSSPIQISLTANHAPGIVTNNSTKDYILTGGFNLNAAQLIKDGSSKLILDNGNANGFGAVEIHNGTLQIGQNDTGGSLGTSTITNQGR